MQPSTPGSRPPRTIAGAIGEAARRRGHAPAVTVLHTTGRQEQGVASLAQWAAKGAHLLQTELELHPGDTIGLDAPAAWTTAAVCLAAWWSGLTVELSDSHEMTVRHERGGDPSSAGWWIGYALDGAPLSEVHGASWTRSVQLLPDQPPPSRPLHVALRAAHDYTQDQLLEAAAQSGAGTAGIEVGVTDDIDALVAVTLRPLLADSHTVVVDGVDRSAADAERVRVWL